MVHALISEAVLLLVSRPKKAWSCRGRDNEGRRRCFPGSSWSPGRRQDATHIAVLLQQKWKQPKSHRAQL